MLDFRHLPLFAAALLLGGCGADVASTAATTARLEATAAEQAKAQKEQFEKKLAEAMKATNEAASAAASQ
jgi:hypothetical protein